MIGRQALQPQMGVGVLAAAIPIAAVVGIAAGVTPVLTAVVFGAICLAPLAFKPGGRLVLFVAGIMFLFQSSAFGVPARAGFVLLAGLGALVAVQSARRRAAELSVDVSGVLRAQGWLIAFCALQVLSYRPSSTSPSDWVRDGTTYALLALAPAFGLDAALHTRASRLQYLTVFVALVGGVTYTLSWLDHRNHAFVEIPQFALVSSMLVVPGIVMALVLYYQRGGRVRWLVVAAVLMGILLSAGGRSTALYVAVGLVCLVLTGLRVRGGINRTFGLLAALGVAALVTIPLSERLTGSSYLTTRLSFFQDASLNAVAADASGQQRLRAYSIMADAFQAHPILGTGFGHNFPSVVTGQVTAGVYALDTPLTLLAKFGFLGTLLLVVALVILFRQVTALSPRGSMPHRRTSLLLLTAGAMWIGALPNGAVTEQKGFAVAVALLVALGVAWSLQPDEGRSDDRPGRKNDRAVAAVHRG